MPTLPLSSRSPNAAVRRPKQLTYYSLDINRDQYLESKSQLKYYYLPDSFLNKRPQLNKGFKDFVKRDTSLETHPDHLLRSIAHYEKEQNGGQRVKADIITYRGIMSRLLTLAERVEQKGNSQDNSFDLDFVINIRHFDGQLFMELDSESLQNIALRQDAGKSEADKDRQEKMTYHGYKFEALSMLPKPWSECTREEIEGRDDQTVDNMCEYCVVARSGVGKIKTVLGAEVDGLWDYDPSGTVDMFSKEKHDTEEASEEKFEPLYDTQVSEGEMLSHYVELKTTMCITNARKAGSFLRFKLLNSWAQSFLIGVTRLVYGFRDEAGILKSVETYKTEELPKMVQQATVLSDDKKWKGNECIAFYAAVLQWVVDSVPKDENQVWRLEYRSGEDHLHLNRISDASKEQALLDGMLLKEFVEWRRSLDKTQ